MTKFSLIACFFVLITVSLTAQTFEKSDDVLVNMYLGPIQWADLDGDADLDIVYTGFTTQPEFRYDMRFYRNDAGSFVSVGTGINPQVDAYNFALGDYDNDGDLDILISGYANAVLATNVYKNDGGFNFSLAQSLPGYNDASSTWIDIDNDNDLDFIVTGTDDALTGVYAEVYENINGTFSKLTAAGLPGCSPCAVDVADSNADGKLDILMNGYGNTPTGIYLNNGDKTFSRDTTAHFRQLQFGDASWGDFDNDGDMDVLIHGYESDAQVFIQHSTIYEHVERGWQERTDISITPATENQRNGSAWVDYDNDGDLDIAFSGNDFFLYTNNGNGNFTMDQNSGLPPLRDSSIDFGDYDNDGDVDVCYIGSSEFENVTGIHKNMIIDGSYAANSKPQPPDASTLSTTSNGTGTIITWGSGTDNQTPPEALRYNVRIRSALGGAIVPSVNETTGFLKTTNPVNAPGRIFVMNDFPDGQYFFSVQTVDGADAGSVFSSEKSFYYMRAPMALKAEIVDLQHMKVSWSDIATTETNYRVEYSTSENSGFSVLSTLPQNTTSYVHNFSFATDTRYYYRIYAVDATHNNEAYAPTTAVIPTAPGNLVVNANASKANVTWEDHSAFESGFVVERKTSTTSFATIGQVPANSLLFVDTNIDSGVGYDYRVKAIGLNGSSDYSNVASIQTSHRPTGATFEKTVLINNTLTFKKEDFTAIFEDEDAGDELVDIRIASLPSKGVLTFSGAPVTVGLRVLTNSISLLTFTPDQGATGSTTFSFYVGDGDNYSAVTYRVIITITGSIVTAIEESNENQVRVYPNPAMSSLVIEMDATMKPPFVVMVNDITGHEITSFTTEKRKNVFEVSGLKPGVYIVNIRQSGKGIFRKKVIKQ